MNSLSLSSFNVIEFDKLVQTLYEGNNVERQKAQLLLTEFQKNPDAWQVADQVLEQSTSLQSKFIMLGILQDFIKVKWNLLPMEQRLVMRNYIVKLIIELASNENTLRSRNIYINKLDQILVQILKKDWPKNWPTFIQEMIDSSLVNTSLCENNMKILKYLSEEIFDFSNDFMTVANKTKLKNSMVSEFNPVFDLCKKVLYTKSINSYLATATLETLLRFISWIPPAYLFQQDLMQLLESIFKQSKIVGQKNLCLQCFTDLINLENIDVQEQGPMLIRIFHFVYNEINNMIPNHADINQVYMNASNEEQHFFQCVAIFFTSYLSKYGAILEPIEDGKLILHHALQLVLRLSRIAEREIWKICLEFWSSSALASYPDIAQELCHVMIDNMVKPDDILWIENDDGDITHEFIKHSDTTALSKMMQLTFHQLTQLQPVYVQTMTHEKLKQLQLTNTTWDQLYHVSWAIGYMSGALSQQEETAFLETVILQDIYQLLFQQKDQQEWVVASCLFYILEQYPHFLSSHLKFASVVFEKMFDYMQHQQTGVREMACDAFVKISKGCRQELNQPIIHGQSILELALINLNSWTAQLNPSQLSLYYEATSILIASLPTPQAQEQSIQLLMETPNAALSSAIRDMNSLTNLKTINSMIRLNTATCKSLGVMYQYQLQKITPSLTQAYGIASQYKNQKTEHRDFYHRICESILKLVEAYVLCQDQLEIESFLFNLIQTIIMDYKNSTDPSLKEPYVLHLMTTLIEALQKPIWPDLLKEIIDLEYVITLPLITTNFVDHPDFRLEFYRLLKIVNKHCFTELYQSPSLFQLHIDSMMWGIKHTTKDISELALEACYDLIQDVSQLEDEDISSQFFENFYVRILTDILEVLVDPDCRNAFRLQSQVLSRLLELVQEGEIYTRLFDPQTVADPLMSNMEFIQQYVLGLLCTAFPLLQKDQIEVLVKGMFEYSGELERFQNDIRDFLIDIREVGDASEGQQRADEELNAELDLLRQT